MTVLHSSSETGARPKRKRMGVEIPRWWFIDSNYPLYIGLHFLANAIPSKQYLVTQQNTQCVVNKNAPGQCEANLLVSCYISIARFIVECLIRRGFMHCNRAYTSG